MAGRRETVWSQDVGLPGWPTVFGIGDASLLSRPCLGLVCSVKCPGSIVLQTYDAIRALRDAGVVVTGGFHSPMERDCLEFLLRGTQPVIWCLARRPTLRAVSEAWRTA